MESPKQFTAKTFLNATTYKPYAKNPNLGIPEAVKIDITDLLKKNGVDSFYSVTGVSRCEANEKGEYGETPTETQFVVTEPQLLSLIVDISRIVDASIVNAKQAEAIKGLVSDCVNDLIDDCWDLIRVVDRTSMLKEAEKLTS